MTVLMIVMMMEDFKSRRIRIVWLVVFIMLSICSSIMINGLSQALHNLFLNNLFLAYMGAGLLLWLFISRRRTGKSIKDSVGLADIFFLFAITPMFTLPTYVYYTLSALLFSIIWWFIATRLGKSIKTIPFVGTAGVIFILFTALF